MKYFLAIWTSTPEDYFYIQNFINYLKKKNINSTLVFQKKNDKKKKNIIKNCKKYQVYSSKNNFLNYICYFYFLIYLAFLVIVKNPKKIYLFDSHSLLSVLLFKPFYKGKIIYHNFDYNPYFKSLSQRFITKIESKLSKFFEILIFSNEKRGKLFQKISKFKKLKIFTIYNSLSINFLNKKNIISYPQKKILFRIGSIGPYHSLDNLIKSMQYLGDDYKLLLCGKITDKKFFIRIKDLIKKNNLEKKVVIKTSVSNSYWKKEMIKSAIGIALYEYKEKLISHKYMCGASQKINAYLSAGLPILLPNEKQYLDFHNKYKCCINVNIKKPLDIANSIKQVLLNKKKYLKLRHNSYEAFSNEFNFEKQIKKIINYIY